jgi:transposase
LRWARANDVVPTVRSVQEIRDPEMLRQVAVLLERENTTLHAKLHDLAEELAGLRGNTLTAQHELAFLKELLAQRERALFGASSEQRPPAEATEPAAPPAPRRGHGPAAQPRLPLIERVHELDPADRTCPQCGGTLQEMKGQTEDSEEITVIERQFVLVKHQRQKYRCACNGCVDTAPGPLRLSARPDGRGHRYAPAFAVEVAIDKYLDHLPLERQARRMRREGLTIDSQTLWDQLEALATALQPSYEAVRQYVLTAPVIGADETWWRFLHGRGAQRWWAWGVTREDAVAYTILESRSQNAARQVLNGYGGIVLADGYGAYDALARAGPRFTLAHCWAHVRRKFVEAEPHYPGPCGEVLDLIGQLYAVERACPSIEAMASAAARAEVLQRRATARREQSIAIVDAIHAWAFRQQVLPESSVGKAIAYMLGLWPGLTRFLGDARIPLDNNATERGLRGVVVGRKNHYGSRSQRGTEVAALFYSLIETAKLCGVNPKTYLLEATHAALATPGTTLLPHVLPN